MGRDDGEGVFPAYRAEPQAKGERLAIPRACGCARRAGHSVVVGGRLAIEIVAKHGGEFHRTVMRIDGVPVPGA